MTTAKAKQTATLKGKDGKYTAAMVTAYKAWLKGERLGGLVHGLGLPRYDVAKGFGDMTGRGMAGFYEARANGAGGIPMRGLRLVKQLEDAKAAKKVPRKARAAKVVEEVIVAEAVAV